jgi:peptidyl-prolyl cis-trans isomerase SurA
VVAVINGDVILQSDVEEEEHFAIFEPYSVPGGTFTAKDAMQHLVNRTLILQQIKEQQIASPPSDAEVTQQLESLRRQIPACGARCKTDAGWAEFLKAHGFTEKEIFDRWKQRMTILRFVDLRFRSGVRISKPEIEAYYEKNVVPEFQKRHVPAPPLKQLTDRIDDVLLQQRVNVLLQDWLKSLRDSGNVAILDPAYGALGTVAAKEVQETTATESEP